MYDYLPLKNRFIKNNVYFRMSKQNFRTMSTSSFGLTEFLAGAIDSPSHSLFKFFTLEEGTENLPLPIPLSQFTTGGGLCICLQGKGDILLDRKNYTIQKGDLCVVFPNTLFQALRKTSDFKGYLLSVAPGFLQNVRVPSATAIYLYIKDHPCISLTGEEQNDLITLCERIKKYDQQKDHPYRQEIVDRQLVILCYEIAALYRKGQPIPDTPGSHMDALFRQFMLLLSTHCETRREVRFYAEKMCITPRYLSTAVKEVSGKTAGNWIAEITVSSIKNQLASTQDSIQQISDRYAFPNPSFFCQFFKKHTGRTPKEYRRENGS